MSIREIVSQLENKIIEVCQQYQGKPLALSGGIDSSLLAALIKPKFAISVQMPDDERFNEIEYAKKVVKHLGIENHIVVKLDTSRFDESMEVAVRAIGRPIPHFNIFPLYEMYKVLAEWGKKELVLGDGADETMCGYARDLIITYLYKIYDFEAFKNYKPLIDKILPSIAESLSRITGRGLKEVEETIALLKPSEACAAVDILLMRNDMDEMTNKIAGHFGITNLRLYQDNVELDNFMRDLPEKAKIYKTEYGKYALRKVLEKYVPHEIAWRKAKIGGCLYPANIIKGWTNTDGDFGKDKYIKYQQEILSR